MQLVENHEIALLRADVRLGLPGPYSPDEKRAICGGIDASSAATDTVMRADFGALPDFATARLLDMLGAPGTPERHWRESVLPGFDSIPDAPPVSA